MGFSWTPKQQQVISMRNRNILVSAAAGSGKTAVLVQRIIDKISDTRKPVDLDKLLIVTFTNAAAAEMRQRIGEAIEEKVEQEPTNVHLLRQLTLLHHAPITTIHSFCLSIIRNYFHRIDLDPAFRIGDEGELKLLQEDVAEKLLEHHYEEAKEDFTQFVDLFASGKDDSGITDMILQLYIFSRSYPWPDEWLEQCRKSYDITTLEDLNKTSWMNFYMEQYRQTIERYSSMYQDILRMCQEEGGPSSYIPVFSLESASIDRAKNAQTYEEAWKLIQEIIFGRKPRKKKSDNFDERLEKRIINLRDHVKDGIRSMQKQYFSRTPEQAVEDIRRAAPFVNVLVELVEEFAKNYAQMKKKKNLIDFNDLEHFALDILIEKNDGQHTFSAVADQYSCNFDEIMIDEYQDSNYVQEMLIQSLSAERFGRPNIFMVGDVKQSIYKFRLAKPEIFMEKYKTYSEEDSKYQKIELHQNFRSRSTVLEGVNFIFYQIMREQLGGINYTRENSLHPGLTYEEVPEQMRENNTFGGSVECMLLDVKEQEDEIDNDELKKKFDIEEEYYDTEEDLTDREWEARMIGNRILQLTDQTSGQLVWDKIERKYRIATFRDIVILLRTMSGWSDTFVNTLMSMGISACAESRSGYFTTIEVQTILNYLRIVDNPMQDIPLAAIMHSPIGNFTSEELAWIKTSYPNEMGGGLWHAIVFFIEHQKNSTLYEKLVEFLNELEEYRTKASYKGIHDILLEILQKTGYYDYVSLMPGGERRRANLDMLLQKALSYENMSYQGVFHFVRYIEKLQKFEVDFGEASVVGEQENTVRIMSIHKSKGLEFPIVIVAGCGKSFNKRETQEKVLMQSDFGVGIDAMNPTLRTKTPTIIKKALQKKIITDNLGEEIRILYVALTRAKEKLIITAAKKNMSTWLEKMLEDVEEDVISQETLNNASSYLDFLIPALSRHRSFLPVWRKMDMAAPIGNAWYDFKNIKRSIWGSWMKMDSEEYNNLFEVFLYDLEDLAGQNRQIEKARAIYKEELYFWNTNIVWDKEFANEIEKKFSYNYAYDNLSKIHATMSVSELKKQSQMQEEEGIVDLYAIPEETKVVPRFIMEQEEQVSGAWRGTVYHRVMEKIQYKLSIDEEEVKHQLCDMVERGILQEEDMKIVRCNRIARFFQSNLYKHLYDAEQRGQLFREQRFIIAVSPEKLEHVKLEDETRVDHSRSGEYFTMIQGVIDLYYEENGKLVLVDYKTDNVSSEEELTMRYYTQLKLYRNALEQMTGKQVKECYIYSFSMGKLIIVPNVIHSSSITKYHSKETEQ